MKTNIAFEHMAAAIPFMAEILDDTDVKELKKAFSDSKKSGGMETGDVWRKIMPVMLVKKPEAVMGLLGALNGKTAEQIAEQEFDVTMEQMRDSMVEDLFTFFYFFMRMAANA